MEQAIKDSAEELEFDLRDKQLEAIVSFVQGYDTFVSLPTGYGKSIIYAILSLVFDKIKGESGYVRIYTACLLASYACCYIGSSGSIVVCVSPLTTLMMDQCAKFTSRGLVAEFVGEAQRDRDIVRRVLEGKVQLVYITPENLIENPKYRSMLLSQAYKENLVALAVDEAHCVKFWGDQFRKTFSMIGDLRSLIPSEVKVLALTATASTETYHSVLQRLAMEAPITVLMPPNRDNIMYLVHSKVDLDSLSDQLYKEFMELDELPKTVVFVRKYRDCSALYMKLQLKLGECFTAPPGYPNISQFRRVEMFNRVLTVDKRKQVLSSFLQSDTNLRLVIATSAFGLGVDIPDVRRIIHWGLPSNLEEYVQEAGRAGRDGKPAQAILYVGKGGKNSSKAMKAYTVNTSSCRRRFLFCGFLSFFEKDIKAIGCKCCDVCELRCKCQMCTP